MKLRVMQGLSFGRLPLAHAAVLAVVTFAAVALLAVVLAYWTWVWLAPRAEPRVAPLALHSESLAAASAMFGTVRHEQSAAAPTGVAIRLLGVVAAAEGRRGYGVVQLDSRQILAVHEGEDVAPGVRLAEVRVDRVILERGGVRETLEWPQRKPSGAPPLQGAQSSGPQPADAVTSKAAQQVAPRARAAAGRRSSAPNP